jgi:hypothetical protein
LRRRLARESLREVARVVSMNVARQKVKPKRE